MVPTLTNHLELLIVCDCLRVAGVADDVQRARRMDCMGTYHPRQYRGRPIEWAGARLQHAIAWPSEHVAVLRKANRSQVSPAVPSMYSSARSSRRSVSS